MKSLIQVLDNEPRVSALTIAENTNNKYASVRDLINRHSEKLKHFGDILTADLKSVVGKQSKKVSFLNEQQATFLMTMLKNSDYILDFKFTLVKEFFAMREVLNPHIDVNIYEINGRIGGLTSANLRYANKIASLEEQIIELKQMNPFQITEVYDNCESFMNDPCLHNNFLEFLYQANKAVHEVNIIRHLSPGLDSTHQSLSNFMLHMTRRYEKVRGMKQYMYN